MPRAALVSLAVCLIAPAGAIADVPTVRVDNGVLKYADTDTTVPPATNGAYSSIMTFVQSGSNYVLRDYQAEMTAGPGCQQVTGDQTRATVTCPVAGVTSAQFDMGLANDSLYWADYINAPPGSWTEPDIPAVINGGDGFDALTDGPRDDTVHGGPRNDTLLTGPGDDKLYGDDGDDGLNRDQQLGGTGPNGADTFDGGAGNDTALYRERTAPVSVTMDGQANDGEAGEHDNIVDAENFIGGQAADTFAGDSSNESFCGGAGKDLYQPGLGADVVGCPDNSFECSLGPCGGDTVSYAERTNPVTVRLHNPGFANGESGENDQIKSDVANVTGGAGDDLLVGNNDDNVLRGGGGNDYLEGLGGADKLHGGSGARDRASWHTRTSTVDVSIDNVANDGAPGEGDNVDVDVEGIYGGDGDDTLAGNGFNNFFRGNGGADSITGGAGLDEILAGEGDDTIEAFDSQKDRVKCEGGTDTAHADSIDVLSDCEVRTTTSTAARARRG